MDHNSRLLIVDDEEHVRETLEMVLMPENYQITFATHGEEALKKAEELIPDLILLDVMMPSMDGYEVCERLRANPKIAEVPILMLTALDDRESRLRGINAGADDFLSKPVDRVELRARIRTIIRLNRYRRLLTERSRFKWAIEQLNDGFLLLNEGGVIDYINSAARFYLNIKTDSEITEVFLSLVDKLYQREPTLAWENWPDLSAPDLPRYLVRPETDHEPSLWLQVNVLEFISGDIKEQLVHLHDVSEKMRLQRQMWSFHMQVSHKLRTPLNALTALPPLTQMDFTKADSQELVEIIQDAIERLKTQLFNVLQYLDSNHLLKLNTTFSLSEFPNLLSTLQETLELNQITLFMDDSLAEKTLLLSKEGLELGLRELLTNAKKFHPQQSPQIDISIKPIDTKNIVLSISDNGKNLPSEVLTQVWTPYFQNEKFFTGEVKGMGLGLPMIARLVWGCGGNCSLHNRDDQPGVTIELILPLTSNENC